MTYERLYEIALPKSAQQLRLSAYHRQLGQKICASFIAQQQGIRVDTALRKIDDNVGDLWLVLAELALQGGLGETPISVRITNDVVPVQ